MSLGEISIPFYVTCENCGEDLEATRMLNGDFINLIITPCKTCIDEARDDSYNDGLEDGRDEANEN